MSEIALRYFNIKKMKIWQNNSNFKSAVGMLVFTISFFLSFLFLKIVLTKIKKKF